MRERGYMYMYTGMKQDLVENFVEHTSYDRYGADIRLGSRKLEKRDQLLMPTENRDNT